MHAVAGSAAAASGLAGGVGGRLENGRRARKAAIHVRRKAKWPSECLTKAAGREKQA